MKEAEKRKKQKRRRDRTEGPVKGSQGAGRVDESLDVGKKGAAAGAAADDKGKAPAGGRPNLPARKGGKK